MSLTKGKPISNYVTIRLKQNDKYRTENGVEIFTPTQSKINNEEEIKPVRGEVIAVPDKLTFIQGDWSNMPWKCEMELQVGDDVIIKRPALSMAISDANSSYFVENDELFVYIKYNELVCAIRGEEIIMLNSMLLVEPEEVELKTTIENFQQEKKTSSCYGRIAHVGKPNLEYHNTKDARGNDVITEDYPNLKVGDRVLFAKAGDIIAETEIFRTLDKKYWRMPRTKILAVI